MLEIRVPDLGLKDDEEVEILAWRAKPGEELVRQAELVDLGVDKVVFTVTAPCEGKLVEVVIEEIGKGKQGDVLCRIERRES